MHFLMAPFRVSCLILLVLVVSVWALALKYGQEWEAWKGRHSRLYATAEEELRRYRVWLSNKEYIDAHNGTREGYFLRMNHFGDLVGESLHAMCIIVPYLIDAGRIL